MNAERILFVTGRLAEFSLRRVLEFLGPRAGFAYEVEVLGISVAALMHVDWVLRKLPDLPGTYSRVLLPGWCQGDLQKLQEQWGTTVERGPKDLQDLPVHFEGRRPEIMDYDNYDIEILAEINHASRLSEAEILQSAQQMVADGADVIDLGCIPGETWGRIGEVTRLLKGEGIRVSVDSFNRAEVEAAVHAGAELVLSCHGENVHWAKDLQVEWVIIPEQPVQWERMAETMAILREAGRTFRVDPILEPIGFGFAESLARYCEARRKWPEIPMLMGIGNLTELTEVDSAGVNVLLAGFCQEQRIHSVLTTQVINWCRSAVKEFDVARRLVRHAVEKKTLPKHVDPRLVMLRDAKVNEQGEETLRHLASQLRDANYRIFVERGEIHIMNRDGYWHGGDPFELFPQLPPLDPAHAFYLGYELAKALTALTLGKQYRQDQTLDWGFLTLPEKSRHQSGEDSSS
ncbi:MAG: DUF6513 domain-containing protein [Planctomycetales bacterium]